MKKYSFIILAFISIFFMSCAEDKGNYDYTKLNEVAINGISSTYNVVSGGYIKIEPQLTRSLSEGEDDLAYSWEIDGKSVSSDRNLDLLLPAMTYGYKTCALVVTDKNTGMKYFHTFEIDVVGKISMGYYFLTQDADNTSIISYLPAVKDTTTVADFIHTKACGDTEIGSEPIGLAGQFSAYFVAGYLKWSIITICKNSKYPSFVIDGETFMPVTTLSEASFSNRTIGYKFNPEEAVFDMLGNLFFISNGQVIGYQSGLLYRPAKHLKNYSWAYPMVSNQPYYYFLYVYDKLSHKYYAIKPYETNNAAGMVADSKAYDDVADITNSPDLSSQNIIGALSILNKANIVCTTDNQGIHLYQFSNDAAKSFQCTGENTLPISGADANSKVVIANNVDYYFVINNKIYTSPIDLPALSEYLTLPTEYGKITSANLSAKNTMLIVTTYDESSSEKLKGSVIFINIKTKQMTIRKNCINKCVSILAANDAPRDIDMNIGGDGK
jgi:hypothetical protein